MTFCDEPPAAVADNDPEMLRILEEMLEADVKITARAVARKHPSVKHASSITRNDTRVALLRQFQAKQKQYREWHDRAPKRSRDQLARQLAQKDARITELERQVEALRISHMAMIRAVGELGGMPKLLKLYEGVRHVRAEPDKMRLLPPVEVRPIAQARGAGSQR